MISRRNQSIWLNVRYGKIKKFFLNQFNYKTYILNSNCFGGDHNLDIEGVYFDVSTITIIVQKVK